jgi:hypothetical protein
MSELADTLGDYVAAETTTTNFAHTTATHVIDDTGLKGRFDFNLNYEGLAILANLRRKWPFRLFAMLPNFASPRKH